MQPLVSVVTITYNQERFIAQAVESVLRQKTDFPFEFIVADDCSQDGTRGEVEARCRAHPGRVKLLANETNLGVKKNEQRALAHCRGEYIAFCEGDDFWCDQDKLQRQVDLIQGIEDCALVHSNFYFLRADGGLTLAHPDGCYPRRSAPGTDLCKRILLDDYRVRTCTALLKRSVLKELVAADPELLGTKWVMGDTPMWSSIAARYRIGYDDKPLAVYRALGNSTCRSTDLAKEYAFQMSTIEMSRYYAARLGLDEGSQRELINSLAAVGMSAARRSGNLRLLRDMYALQTRKTLKDRIIVNAYRSGLGRALLFCAAKCRRMLAGTVGHAGEVLKAR